MGRHEEAVERCITALKRDQLVTDHDEAALTLLRAGARSLDIGEDQGKPYVAAHMLPPVLAVLTQMRMTVETRANAENDAMEQLLSDLAKPSA